MTDSTVLATAIGAISTGLASLLTYIGVRRDAKSKAQVEAETARREAEAVDDERWRLMLEAQREGFDSLLDPLRDETRDLRGQVNELRGEVTRLSGEVHHRDIVIGAFVVHVRDFRDHWERNLPDTPPPTPMDTIAHLI